MSSTATKNPIINRVNGNGSSNGVSSQNIARDLRRGITAGVLAPGAQLPTRLELESKYGTTSVTIQRALDRLVRDEFIYVNGRRGTYVSPHPPHLSRYALVFRHDPDRDHETWTAFYSALTNQAARLQRRDERNISTYTAVDGHVDSPNFNKLLEEIAAERLAGIVFVDGIFGLENSPLVTSTHLPKVSIGAVKAENCTALLLNEDSFIKRALEHFEKQNRKRLAIITHRMSNHPFSRALMQAAHKRGFEIEPFWNQVCFAAQAPAARAQAHLLMKCTSRPNALLITDDNLVEHATAGLVEAGVLVPQDIEVVGHANFPEPTTAVVAARRLGYDTVEILEAALASIDARRREEKTAASFSMDAVFAEEAKSLHPPAR